jgi:hypothetical protein
MDLQKQLKLLGIASIVIGSISALLCLTTIQWFIYAIPLGFVGMMCSGIYVFIDTKNEINKKRITPGIIGMILSSVPVLFILTFMIIHHFNKPS